MPKPIPEAALDVVETLYDAALEESLWPDALKKLAEFMASQAATLWVLEGPGLPRRLVYVNIDPAFVHDSLNEEESPDATAQFLARGVTDSFIHDTPRIGERTGNAPPGCESGRRHGDFCFSLVGRVSPAPDVQAGIAVHRTRDGGQYASKDIEQFDRMQGHLGRALRIGCTLGTLGTMQHLSVSFLDRNPAGVVLLDERRRLVYANRSARTLASLGDGIAIGADGVRASRAHDEERLSRLIAEALARGARTDSARGGAMRVSRPSGKRPYTILVAPVSDQHPVLSALRRAVSVVISDPDGDAPLPVERLQAAFGLTEAEARLASLIGSGEGLRSAANRLRITYGTARVRLAEIFGKTETRRQGDLIKLLLTTMAVA